MEKSLITRLEAIESLFRAARSDFIIHITNNKVKIVEIPEIIRPGRESKWGKTIVTEKEYDSPLEAVDAIRDMLYTQKHRRASVTCKFDDIIAALYPEVAGAFTDFTPIKSMLSPLYGYNNPSRREYELRHIQLYHHAAWCTYHAEHNKYAENEHDDADWFESLMQSDDPDQSQIDLLNVVLQYEMNKNTNTKES